MVYTRPEYIDEETWARLPTEAQRQLDAAPPNQRSLEDLGGAAYAVFGEPSAPEAGLQVRYPS
jgi:hypothetical protein